MSSRVITFTDGFSSATAPTAIDGVDLWATATSYVLNDLVIEGVTIYICLIPHTSGVFATDLAALKWSVSNITKDSIGLGNVDNTSDATKNSATVTLTNKTLTAPVINSPTGLVKADVGLGNVDNTSDATKNAASVTLTNKTITGASIVTPSRLDMKQDTLSNLQTYASTAADGQLCFATDTKATYVVKSSNLSSVGGGGLSNYILSPDSDSGIGLWATYKNASGASTPDGTITGTANSTFAVSTSASMRGTSNFLWTKNSGASRQGEGVYYPFSIDASDKGKVLQISFEYLINSGTFIDDAMEVFIWDVTNSRLIQPAPSKIKNSGLIEKYGCEFQSSIDSTSYRLFIHVGVTTDSSNTIRFDSFNISAQAKLYGSPITDATSYTPTLNSNTSVLSNSATWCKVGDRIVIQGRIEYNGVGNASALTISPPAGLSIDAAKIASLSTSNIGSGYWSDAGTSFKSLMARSNAATSFAFYEHGGTVTLNSSTFASGDVISYTITAPIQGWSSSSIMSSDANTRVIAAIATGTPANVTSGNPIIFPTSSSDSTASYNTTTGRFTAPVSGLYNISCSGNVTAGTSAILSVYINASIYKNIGNVNIDSGYYVSNGLVSLNAGDIADVRPNASLSFGSTGIISFSKISGPSQIAASESVSALYTGAPPTGTLNSSINLVTYGTKVKDTHGAYSSGSYTVPASGTYSVSAVFSYSGTMALNQNAAIYIYVNGVSKHYTLHRISGAININQVSVSVGSLPLLAGDVVSIRSAVDASGPAFRSVADENYFSITRTGNY